MIKKLHVSKNLLASLTKNYAIDASGNINSNNEFMYYTAPCEANETYTFSLDRGISGNYVRIHAFNGDTWIEQLSGKPIDSAPFTVTAPVNTTNLKISITKAAETYHTMLNTGSTPLPYEPYGDTWNTKSYAKIVDTTQQVTSFPVVVRPMENTIPSWTIKGNMVQDGTPSPSNIIYPSETGERTENLFDSWGVVGVLTSTGTIDNSSTYANYRTTDYIPVEEGSYTFSLDNTVYEQYNNTSSRYAFYDEDKVFINYDISLMRPARFEWTFAAPSNAKYVRLTGRISDDNIMLNTGSTALPYEPYGYKLDIKSGNTTTPVYLGQVESTRKIKQLVLTGEENWRVWSLPSSYSVERYYINITNVQTQLGSICSHFTWELSDTDLEHFRFGGTNLSEFLIYIKKETAPTVDDFKAYLAQQYSAGTPVTLWYILTNETTTTLNEPLRKIGTYSDSVSGTNLAVTAQSPTTIDVDTSLKPSEMDLTYTGKKMCKRKKAVRTANIYDKYNTIDIQNLGTRYGIYCNIGTYSIYNNTDNIVYWGAKNLTQRHEACQPHSTATVTMYGDERGGFFMPYNDGSLGEVTIVQGSTVPDHYIPYIDWQ